MARLRRFHLGNSSVAIVRKHSTAYSVSIVTSASILDSSPAFAKHAAEVSARSVICATTSSVSIPTDLVESCLNATVTRPRLRPRPHRLLMLLLQQQPQWPQPSSRCGNSQRPQASCKVSHRKIAIQQMEAAVTLYHRAAPHQQHQLARHIAQRNCHSWRTRPYSMLNEGRALLQVRVSYHQYQHQLAPKSQPQLIDCKIVSRMSH